jgi:hypothetical protein
VKTSRFRLFVTRPTSVVRWRRRVFCVACLASVVLLAGGSLQRAGAADYNGTITAGGSAVTVTLPNSGDTGYLTFTASSGDRVSVKASTGSLGGLGYTMSLLDPGSSSLGSVFIGSSSNGLIDATTLSSSGTYTIKLLPYSSTTGTTTVTLYSVTDATGSNNLGGSSDVETLSSPGQN